MVNIFNNIEIICKSCKRKIKKNISLAASYSNFTCACGTKITLDTRQYKDEVNKVEKHHYSKTLENKAMKINKRF
jgi:hypothetical protein